MIGKVFPGGNGHGVLVTCKNESQCPPWPLNGALLA